MGKAPKTPRPQKSPVLPALENQIVDPTISMLTERLIGRAIVAWSKLENCMDDFIWALLAVPIEQGRVLTVRMDAVRKIQTLRRLGELVLSTEKFHVLSPILDRVDILREDRNLIGHGSWARSGFDRLTVVASLKPEALNPDEVVSETFPDRRLRAVIDGIEKTKWELIPLMEERYASLDKSLRQHRGG
jgi:hypothetical protein